MNESGYSLSTRWKVGSFCFLGFFSVGIFLLLLSNRPYWWRPCHLVYVTLNDAMGLKFKTPVRSLGIEIGYLKSVDLLSSRVLLGVCVTAPVEVFEDTRAYVRAEGFLGDKFLELKPVRCASPSVLYEKAPVLPGISVEDSQERRPRSFWKTLFFSEAFAATSEKPHYVQMGSETHDVNLLVDQMSKVLEEVGRLVSRVETSLSSEELKKVLNRVNSVLDHAGATLSPEGSLSRTAQRSLGKLEESIEQLRDLFTRINQGNGSVGMLLNDPSYAQEIKKILENANRFLNRYNEVEFIVDLGGGALPAYEGGRGYFQLGIWPKKDRYYLLGIASDSRGKLSNSTVTTIAGGQKVTTQTQVADQTGLLFTLMLGKVFFSRFDFAVGALYGDGAFSTTLYLGPGEHLRRIALKNDVYVRNSVGSLHDRLSLQIFPSQQLYLSAGYESLGRVNGRFPYFYGGGIRFTDEDIKLLFALK
jgi:phospholipid/cholesterol/gamma-HCH transport system substrate-binding protein